jgi:serine protease inhibitor
MTRREFLWSLPVSVGAAGCLGLDPRSVTAPLEAATFSSCIAPLGFELFREIRKQPGNLVCSPFLTASVLSLGSAGARGETLDEFRRVLHWPDDPGALHSAAAAWRRQIAASLASSRCEMRAAYALWTDKALPISPELRAIAEKNYDGAWQSTEFRQPDVAVRSINQWAELHTSAKVRELIRPRDFDASTRMLLAAATYFKGMWAHSFPIAGTSYDTFESSNGAKSSAAYMRHIAPHRFAETATGQMVELALAGRMLAMYLLLPPPGQTLATFESALDAAAFQRLLDGLQMHTVVVTMPRFSIASEIRLSEPLIALGMSRAFRPSEADFTGVSPMGQFALGGVIQKVGIEATEEGTDTAPATGAAARAMDSPEVAEQAKTFVANRPFVFVVRDAVSGSVLYLGRVEKPG